LHLSRVNRQQSVLPPPWEQVVHETWSEERVLPWEHLQGPLPKATLASHRREALATG
jgi:hypothetical protein